MLEAKEVTKCFGEPSVQVLFGISMRIGQGEFVSITGKSGSGKSTLLYIISSLDAPSTGEVLIDGRSTAVMNEDELHEFRNRKMGFVFQFHYLLPELTALENVLMPARKVGLQEELTERGAGLLDRFGLSQKSNRLPRQLSGGEQQRVAIARALVMEPEYVFADEPTGSLDSVNSRLVMDILEGIVAGGKTSVIYVTHDLDFAERATHKIQIADGRVILDEVRAKS